MKKSKQNLIEFKKFLKENNFEFRIYLKTVIGDHKQYSFYLIDNKIKNGLNHCGLVFIDSLIHSHSNIEPNIIDMLNNISIFKENNFANFNDNYKNMLSKICDKIESFKGVVNE